MWATTRQISQRHLTYTARKNASGMGRPYFERTIIRSPYVVENGSGGGSLDIPRVTLVKLIDASVEIQKFRDVLRSAEEVCDVRKQVQAGERGSRYRQW